MSLVTWETIQNNKLQLSLRAYDDTLYVKRFLLNYDHKDILTSKKLE